MRILFFSLLLFYAEAFAFVDAEGNEWTQLEDMIVPVESIVNKNSAIDKGLMPKGVRLWKDGIVRYSFSSNVSMSNRQMFLQACAKMGEFADIKCLPRRSFDSDYIFVQHTNNPGICGSSFLGRYGGRQAYKIRCWRMRTLQHELMHALGLTHEHNRMDRDEHIVIRWENILPGLENNYERISLSNTHRVLGYYDFASIMQYDSYGGSRNGDIVMYRKDLGPVTGRINDSDVMSFGDHYILYSLYGGTRP